MKDKLFTIQNNHLKLKFKDIKAVTFKVDKLFMFKEDKLNIVLVVNTLLGKPNILLADNTFQELLEVKLFIKLDIPQSKENIELVKQLMAMSQLDINKLNMLLVGQESLEVKLLLEDIPLSKLTLLVDQELEVQESDNKLQILDTDLYSF